MNKAIFYASNKGFAGNVAKKIGEKLNVSEVFDVKNISVKKMNDYEAVILVVATHKVGQIQNDLAAQLEDFQAIDWSKKTVAIVGLGDGKGHGETFNNAIGKIYDIVHAAHVIGFTEDTGYEYQATDAIRNGKFAGLPLDEINQPGLTESRIDLWLKNVTGIL